MKFEVSLVKVNNPAFENVGLGNFPYHKKIWRAVVTPKDEKLKPVTAENPGPIQAVTQAMFLLPHGIFVQVNDPTEKSE